MVTHFAKYRGPGRRAPGLMYTRHRLSQRSRHLRQDSLLSATVLLSTSECPPSPGVFPTLTMAAIRGPRLKLLLWIFCVTKFTQNFLRRHLKENDLLKILAACHSGAPFQPGALRTCVPCLMVNPALFMST